MKQAVNHLVSELFQQVKQTIFNSTASLQQDAAPYNIHHTAACLRLDGEKSGHATGTGVILHDEEREREKGEREKRESKLLK